MKTRWSMDHSSFTWHVKHNLHHIHYIVHVNVHGESVKRTALTRCSGLCEISSRDRRRAALRASRARSKCPLRGTADRPARAFSRSLGDIARRPALSSRRARLKNFSPCVPGAVPRTRVCVCVCVCVIHVPEYLLCVAPECSRFSARGEARYIRGRHG